MKHHHCDCSMDEHEHHESTMSIMDVAAIIITTKKGA